MLLALDRKERIILFGDYDVDGVTSLALLSRRAARLRGRIILPLPRGGYGLSREA